MTSRFQYDLVAFVIFALVIAFGVPALMNYDGFELNTFARYLALAIVSMALALSWGTAGLLNLGQAATFGMGSYAMAMHLKLHASDGLPDFMGWNNVPELPLIWVPFESLAFTLLAGLLIPAFIGGLIAIFMFRARIAGVFVAIITLAFLVALSVAGHRPAGPDGRAERADRPGTACAARLDGRSLQHGVLLPRGRVPDGCAGHRYLSDPQQVRPDPQSHPRGRGPDPLFRLQCLDLPEPRSFASRPRSRAGQACSTRWCWNLPRPPIWACRSAWRS